MTQRIGLILLVTLLIGFGTNLFAQRSGQLDNQPQTSNTFTLIVRTNVPGAIIQINNNILNGNRFELRPAVYSVIVRAPGFKDFSTTVNMNSDQVITANLQPDRQKERPRERDDDANLFVNSNVRGAQVFINDTLVGVIGATFTIPSGSYQIRVSAPGYQDFVSSLQVDGNQTVNAILSPMSLMLTVNANVKNAQVFINNNPVGVAGSVFSMQPGSYQVRVSAPGFTDFVTTVNLNSNQILSANLNALNYTLAISANIKKAQVYLNNNLVGLSDQVYSLQPGAYQLRVSAPGFQDFATTIQLNGNQVINAVLQPMTGMLVVDMPKNTAMIVFIDGAVQKRPGSFALPAGQHRVRFELGFLAAETMVTVISGQTVTVSPAFTVIVK